MAVVTPEETHAFFDRYAHALSTADRTTALTLVTDVLDHNGVRMPAERWWADHVAANIACIAGYTWTIDELIVAGDRVTVRYTDTGTLVRPWVGLTDLGRPISFREYVVYRLDAGRITEVWSVFDHWALVQPADPAGSAATVDGGALA